MIKRYSRDIMANLWTDEKKFSSWLNVELALANVQLDLGLIPVEAKNCFNKDYKINIDRILEIESETHHDVIAFCTSITEQMDENGRFLHMGVTSSDVIDTGLSLQIKESAEIIKEDIDKVLNSLKNISLKHKDTLTIGRSHGIHAEYTSFGLKFLSSYSEFKRNQTRMNRAFDQLKTGKLSGPVGNYTSITPEIEAKVCEKLGLSPEPVSTQIIPRDRLAELFMAGSLMAASIERISVELRHLQRTEVLEVEEGFSKKQKGSSAMPHKKNPVSSENLTGCSRMLRSYMGAALENIPLWHERDISHSSVERVFLPDFFILLDYALNRLNRLIENLVVKEDNIQSNLEMLRGLPFSGAILNEMVQAGVSREKAYRIIQRAAHGSWDSKQDFKETLKSDKEFTEIFEDSKIEEFFSESNYLRHVDEIYNRFF
jgi:adenylosuccinate lyase